MGKTFDQSLIDTAVISMSMIDPDDMADTTSEEYTSLRRIQQGCHNELTNREDFPFNEYTKNIQLGKNVGSYSVPDGRITQIKINNGSGVYKLKHNTDIDLLGDASGMPEYYAVDYNPNKIKFYPVPDNNYNASIDYISTKNVELADGTLSYTIETGSKLRMPEQFQHLYFDALEYYVLYEYMRKASNPRFEPTYKIFKEKWSAFLRGSKPVESETMFTI